MSRHHPNTDNGRKRPAARRTEESASGTALPPIEQRIRELAYGYFVERGCAEGHDLDDWLRAEAQVRTSDASAASSSSITAT